ncbi:phytochrome sensor protein (plasmid) [Pantoea agglomerans]|uniref:fimbrial biogenesis chaperone n=1 Tax=Enterobacter agglomerans TaxID=549 RepID=UPI00083CA91A|nr:molecular chaperone [Pantoea agglomerans]AOE42554.1 phytochrome sensor protein [Pantoea agglomerans]
MKYFFHSLLFCFFLISFETKATIVPLQDRIIFSRPDIDRRLLIVNNDSHAPVLLQSWVDEGDSGDINKEKNYPFVIIPAVAKMYPGKLLNLKVFPTEKIRDLPQDRESVFWINLYEIPGIRKSHQDKNSNKMEVGLVSQLKITYRPFRDSMNIKSIADAILIHITDNGHSLELVNSSPYYVTPVSVKVKSPSGEQLLKMGMNRMIGPFSKKRFSMKKLTESKNITVEYVLVDDAGKNASFSKVLN